MISKEELVDKIESTKLERTQELGDSYEKKIYLDEDIVLIVGYDKEEEFEKPWMLRQENCEKLFLVLGASKFSNMGLYYFENKDKSYTFCESWIETWSR